MVPKIEINLAPPSDSPSDPLSVIRMKVEIGKTEKCKVKFVKQYTT